MLDVRSPVTKVGIVVYILPVMTPEPAHCCPSGKERSCYVPPFRFSRPACRFGGPPDERCKCLGGSHNVHGQDCLGDALGGQFLTEDFNDEQLNDGVSFVFFRVGTHQPDIRVLPRRSHV